jgi:hypothetical protein
LKSVTNLVLGVISSGDVTAFAISPRAAAIRYVLALRPFFEGEALSLYTGTIEYTGRNYAPIWETLLQTPGLKFVCVGYEEGVQLRDDRLSVETFPWKDWPLVIGALRSNPDSKSWVIREGPEIKRFSPRSAI